jgi:hypothetical protein
VLQVLAGGEGEVREARRKGGRRRGGKELRAIHAEHNTGVARVGLLWRREWDPAADPAASKLCGVFAAFATLGVQAEPVVYDDARVDAVRTQLRPLDGVLVWVNPIEHGLDRAVLDSLLREAADSGVFVSAHPDVILRMGTKQVLADTQGMSWGTPTRVFRSVEELREGLEHDRVVVLKQHRGMGGDGVWKVERVGPDGLEVQHAAGAARPERVSIESFVGRCSTYFANDGRVVEQPYQPRIGDGMTRVYCSHDAVVGFAHQYPRGLLPPSVDPNSLPTAKRFERADAPAFVELRERMEGEWLPELQRLLGLRRTELPVIWDADFLRAEDGRPVLCEINVSSTFAFPEHAYSAVARAALDRIAERKFPASAASHS